MSKRGNEANFRVLSDTQKLKSFRLQRGFAPDTVTRGSAPGPLWGLRPQMPRHTSGEQCTDATEAAYVMPDT